MRKVIALAVAAAMLGLVAGEALAQSDATCVNALNAQIAARNETVEAKIQEYKYYQCVNPDTGASCKTLWLS